MLLGEKALTDFVDVVGKRAGPDHQRVVFEDVLQKWGQVWPFDEKMAAWFAFYERAVEVDDKEEGTGGFGFLGLLGRLLEVLRCRYRSREWLWKELVPEIVGALNFR